MLIKFDENGYIEGFCTFGDMEGAVQYDGAIPEDFTRNCRFYKLVDGTLTLDNEKKLVEEQIEETKKRIAELKSFLSVTDYQAIKYAEGSLSAEDFGLIREQRQLWRDEINVLEEAWI